ncbi:MAG: hypothetical protein KDB80_05930 [Planctomycetes bacterium]|nr:hypothetical protein [Planctomycetota bacterium]
MSEFRSVAIATIAAGAVLALAPRAQITLDPNIGSPLGMTDDSIAPDNPLGFEFTFPDGSAVTHVEIDSNGRILMPLSDTTDGSESVVEFMGQRASICAYWDDLTPDGPGTDDVYFHSYFDGTQQVAVITWRDVVEFGAAMPFTFQVVLREDDTFSMYWDARTPATDALVGITSGDGTPDPGSRDLSCGPTLVTRSDPTLYEQFTSFDLQDAWLDFSRDGTGGWVVATPFVGSCPPGPQHAVATRVGVGCGGQPPLTSKMEFVPDFVGGYIVLPATVDFDPSFGSGLGITSNNSTQPADLGFDFTMPDGQIVTSIDVDVNGRLVLNAQSDPTPTVSDLLNHAGPVIAPLWGNFEVTGSVAQGTVMFASNGVDYAVITWDRVGYAGAQRPVTWQVQLFGATHPARPNSWAVLYEDLEGFRIHDNPAFRHWIVGCSAGSGAADPGESDFSADLPIVSLSNPNIYEFFDRAVPEVWDLTNDGPSTLQLSFDSRPVIGGTFDLTLRNIHQSATSAWILIGFQNVDTDLSILGLPCSLYSSANFPAQPMVWTQGTGTASYSLPISGAPGIPLVLQAVTVRFGSNPLNVEFSNAVAGRTGS